MTKLLLSDLQDQTYRQAHFDVKDIKVISVDLDGTTLNPDQQWSDYTCRVFDALVKRGITIIPATGRGTQYIGPLTDREAQFGWNFPKVLNNGSVLLVNGEFLSFPLPNQLLQQMAHLALPTNFSWSAMSPDGYYWRQGHNNVVKLPNDHLADDPFGNVVEVSRKALTAKENGTYQVGPTFLFPGEQLVDTGTWIVFITDEEDMHGHTHDSARINQVYAELEQMLAGQDIAEMVFVEPNEFAVTAHGVDKANAVAKYLSQHNLNAQQHLLAFGDNMNDLSNLLQAKYGFYMTNPNAQTLNKFQAIDGLYQIGTNRESSPAQVLNALFDLGIDYEPNTAELVTYDK